MPELTPYKPKGELESIRIHLQQPGLGITLDGHASNISIYGIQNLVFHHVEYVYFQLIQLKLLLKT